MPTQRFFKLKEEKRRLILEAAAHEFSRVPYSAASINQIIKEADISRGSFYTYFEDKDDLMRYMLRGMREHFRERVMLLLKEMGSPFAVCLQMVREWMDKGNDHIFYKIHKNLLSDLSVSNQNQIFGFRGFTLKDDPYEGFIKDIYEHMDREHYPMSLEARYGMYSGDEPLLPEAAGKGIYFTGNRNRDEDFGKRRLQSAGGKIG